MRLVVRRNRKSNVCNKRKGKFNTRKRVRRNATPSKRKIKGGSPEVITDTELDKIIRNIKLDAINDAEKIRQINDMKPRLSKLKFNPKYISCFGYPVKDIEQMIAAKLQCFVRSEGDIIDEDDTFIA